jgi:hypothetical protein
MASDLPTVEELWPVPPDRMNHILLVRGRPQARVALITVQSSLLNILHTVENGRSSTSTAVLMTLPLNSTRQLDILIIAYRWIACIILVIVDVEGAHA